MAVLISEISKFSLTSKYDTDIEYSRNVSYII